MGEQQPRENDCCRSQKDVGLLLCSHYARHVYFCVDQTHRDRPTIHNFRTAQDPEHLIPAFVAQDEQMNGTAENNAAAGHGVELSPDWDELEPFEILDEHDPFGIWMSSCIHRCFHFKFLTTM
jgi:hypothetical protein